MVELTVVFVLGAAVAVGGIWLGSVIQDRAYRQSVRSTNSLPFIIRTEPQEEIIEKAYHELEREKVEKHLPDIFDNVEGLGK